MSQNPATFFEWHIFERLTSEISSVECRALHAGPFASEEECSELLKNLTQMARFRRGKFEVRKQYKRRQKRIQMKLAVHVCHPATREQSWPAHTLDISALGSRLFGLADHVKYADIIEIRHARRRAIFKVIWVGAHGTSAEGQTGVECLNPEANIWDLDLSEQTDDEPLLREIAVARGVQSKFLPREKPRLQTLDYSGNCTQARILGGDYYDFFDTGPQQVGFVLADVAGKGIPAALLMANLQGSFHSHGGHIGFRDMPRLLASVNRHLYKHTDPGRYASLFFGCYNDDSRSLRYVNCGHNPPLLLRQTGVVERLTATATVLGLFRDWECAVGQLRLETGDVLAMFTDGIIETVGKTGEEFGEDRLLGTLRQSGSVEAATILHNVEQAVGQFRSGSHPEDDLTLVVACAQ